MSRTPIRVIQAYTGKIAVEQVRMLADRPDVEFVGALVHHDEKAGRDLGELAGIDPLGVAATNALDEILDLDADVVLHNPGRDSPQEVIALLGSGKSVITCAGGTNPKAKPEYHEYVAACEQGGSTYFATGINPGYAPDVLPMVASAVCSRVDAVTVYAGGNLAGVESTGIGIMGFGGDPAAHREQSVYMEMARGPYLETAKLLAELVSLPVDRWDVEPEFEPATADFAVGELPIPRGTIAGVRLRIVGWVGERRAVVHENTWFLGREHLPAEWLGHARGSGWTVEIEGDPDVRLSLDVDLRKRPNAGTRLTAARMVNSLVPVHEAPPGILSYVDLPTPRVWQ